MKHTLTSKAAELMRKNGRHRRWRRAFSGMAAVVVFITTYMLILPAITMENQAICGMAEHTHTDACYEMQLVCTQEETPEGADVHVHGPECYEQQQVLTCTKQEGEGHTHTDACYGYVCGQEESAGHTHTDACYTEVTHRELTCTEPESAGHSHSDGCYDEEGNLVCSESQSAGHTHSDSCYTETVTRELTCGQEESSGHTHTDACIGLICGQEEYEGHTHTDACYTTEDVLVCTEPTGHTHGDGCYEKVLVCDVPEHTHTEECYPAAEPEEPQEPEFICTLPEHSHEDACYDADGNLICGMEEHTHTEECYAPVEIPEEETPTTAFPEEIPEGYVEYTFDNEAGLTVTAYAPEGAFGQDVQLFAEVLSEDSEEYAQAKENLDKAENAPEYTGMAAMDIRFVDADGNEVEPDASLGQVFVKIDAQALIPEDVDESTLAVQHHAKVSDGGIFGTGIFEHTDVVVETVADNTEETGDITAVPDETALPETLPALADEPEMAEAATLEEPAAETETEETQPAAMNVEAEFAVNSFSYFTITYNYNSLRASIVTPSGSDITIPNWSKKSVSASTDWMYIDDILSGVGLSKTITDTSGKTYEFTGAKANYATGSPVNYVKYKTGWSSGWRYSTTNNSYGNGTSLTTLYLVYEEKVTFDTVDTVDPPGVNISLFDYNGIEYGYSGNNNGGASGYPKGYGYDVTDDINYNGYNRRPFIFSGFSESNNYNNYTSGDNGLKQGMLLSTLGSDGYPILDPSKFSGGGSLAYLFNGSTDGVASSYTGLTGLFQQDSAGYYYYDSAQNFAELNDDGESFTVYAIANQATNNKGGNFHPFNDFEAAEGTIYRNGHQTTNPEQDGNYHFGMTIDFDFIMPKEGKVNGNNMIFEFDGDDDVWVFIDDVLVLDIGGIHDHFYGSIDFASGDVIIKNPQTGNILQSTDLDTLFGEAGKDWDGSDYSTHELKFFYFERGLGDSNCMIKFNLYTIQKNSLNVSKSLEAVEGASEEINQYLSNLEYKFRVLNADAEPGTINESDLFIEPNTSFDIYKNGVDTGRDGTVASDGTFVIKANETAVFTNISEDEGSYYVQEIVEKEYSEQFGDVEVSVEPNGGTSYGDDNGVTIDDQKFVGVVSGDLNASATGFVNFTNKVDISKLSLLRITKDAANGSSFGDDETFTIHVTMGGEDVPEGTTYQLYESGNDVGTSMTVSTAGEITLQPGQTAAFPVLTGTEYTVSEVNGSTYHVGYTATQTIGTITWTSDTGYNLTVTNSESGDAVASGVVGQIIDGITDATNATVEVTITNQSYDFNTSVEISKILTGYTSGNYEFTFNVVQVQDANNHTEVTESKAGTPVGATITVDSADEETGTVYFGFKNNVSDSTYYYKVSEVIPGDTGGISYDESYYIVKVEIRSNGTGKTASVTDVTKYSGGEVDGSFSWNTGTALSFTNSLTGSLSITKTVTYNGDPKYTSNAVFAFDVTLKDGVLEGPYDLTYTYPTEKGFDDYSWPDSIESEPAQVSVENGKLTVYVPAGATIQISGLPAAAQATITETTTDGYSTKWSGDTHPNRSEVMGATVTTAKISGNPAVTCTNTTGAVLPSTGGMGTTPFLALGTLLTLGAGMLLVQRRRKEGSDAV